MAKAQTAIEYLIIVGFAVSVLAILTVVYYEHESSSRIQIVNSQVDRLAKKLVDSAEEVYYLGVPTRSTIKAYVPTNIEQIVINSHEINFRIRSKEGVSDTEYVSAVNITGSISSTQGIKYIRVIAQSGRVCIVEQDQPECP
jgi:hypothetical protein